MNHSVLDCPHCGSKKITFDVADGTRLRKLDGEFRYYWNLFLTCRHCTNGLVAVFANQQDESTSPAVFDGDPQDEGFILIQTFPAQQKLNIPEHLTNPIAKNFEEAVDNLNSGRYTSAGMMFRRVLQRSTTALMDEPGTLKSKDLKKRIDILANEGIITEAMRDWADIIRLEGNSANHDEEEHGQDEFTLQDATQLHQFTELFLIYAFTLPARVKQYRETSKTSEQPDNA